MSNRRRTRMQRAARQAAHPRCPKCKPRSRLTLKTDGEGHQHVVCPGCGWDATKAGVFR